MFFISGWREKTETGLPPVPVVEDLNIFCYISYCFMSRPVAAMMNQFGFQATEEILHRGIIETVPLRLMEASMPNCFSNF
jgi:transposase-like protein